jgi:hypothetical protein
MIMWGTSLQPFSVTVFKVYPFLGNFQPIRPTLRFSAKYRKFKSRPPGSSAGQASAAERERGGICIFCCSGNTKDTRFAYSVNYRRSK